MILEKIKNDSLRELNLSLQNGIEGINQLVNNEISKDIKFYTKAITKGMREMIGAMG